VEPFGGHVGLCWRILATRWAMLGHLGAILRHLGDKMRPKSAKTSPRCAQERQEEPKRAKKGKNINPPAFGQAQPGAVVTPRAVSYSLSL